MSAGSVFQACGPATESARSPILSHKCTYLLTYWLLWLLPSGWKVACCTDLSHYRLPVLQPLDWSRVHILWLTFYFLCSWLVFCFNLFLCHFFIWFMLGIKTVLTVCQFSSACEIFAYCVITVVAPVWRVCAVWIIRHFLQGVWHHALMLVLESSVPCRVTSSQHFSHLAVVSLCQLHMLLRKVSWCSVMLQ